MTRVGVMFLALSAGGTVLVPGERRVPERELLRGFLVSRCLASAYAGQEAGRDANRSAEGYRDAGHATRAWVYEELGRLARETGVSSAKADQDATLAAMRCLEMAESRDAKAVLAGRRPANFATRG